MSFEETLKPRNLVWESKDFSDVWENVGFIGDGQQGASILLENVNWTLYVREAGEYDVTGCYHSLTDGAGIKVEVGNGAVSGKTSAGADVKQSLGTLKVSAGNYRWVWSITDTDGVERVRPQALILKPCK